MSETVFTIGHGDRTLENLVESLRSFGVATVVDVRSYPASRAHPHFGREALEPALTAEGFLYRWLGRELGGFRQVGYETHMETDLFAEGIERLAAIATDSPTAILCAERDPAGCHRRFIATTLESRNMTIRHIVDPDRHLLPGERPEDQGTLFDL